jgi:hypothetical protein
VLLLAFSVERNNLRIQRVKTGILCGRAGYSSLDGHVTKHRNFFSKENLMKMFALALAAMVGLGALANYSRAEDEKKADGKITGVLIDQMCAKKMMDKDDPQAAAAEHKKACCEKCAKDGGMAVISGKKMYLLDDAGKEKAMKYLGKHDNMNVVVEGEAKDDMLTVKSIHEDKDKKSEKKEG